MNCLGENARDFLRQRAMFRRGAPSQRLFQFVGHVGADEYPFAIGHLFSMSPCEKRSIGLGKFRLFETLDLPRARKRALSLRPPRDQSHAIESKSVSRILCSDSRFETSDLRSQI